MKLKQKQNKRSGFVLILVLGMVMLMSVLLLGFNNNSRAALGAADNLKNRSKALNSARTALNVAIAVVRDNNDIYADRTLRDLVSGRAVLDIDGAECSITIVEENSKLNLNLLTDKSGKLNRTAIDQLLRLIDILNNNQTNERPIGYGIVPAIIDWIDTDSKVIYLPFIKNSSIGAESAYYNGLKKPYDCRNAPLDTVADIATVKGMTRQIFRRISDHVTVYGDGKISINSASAQTIQSFSHQIDPALARMIVDRREFKPFDSFDDIRTMPAVTDSIYRTIRDKTVITSENQYYRINSRANLDEINTEITAVIRKNTDTKSIDVIMYQEL